MKVKVSALALVIAFSAVADANAPGHSYSSGFSIAMKIGQGLFEALPSKFGDQITADPVTLQAQDIPIITPAMTSDDNKSVRLVAISAGFLDFINHVSHAKAIDRIQPGFFDSYVQNLGRMNSDQYVAEAPEIIDPRFWTDDVLNDQISYFSQMVSMLMAINLSHHYLGHYSKYADRMIGPDNKPVPINQLLSQAEWEVSVKAGACNSMDCALATEGLKALFDAIDKMPRRPPWTAYIVPQNADLKKLNKQLDRYEYDFFHGKLRN